MVNRNGAAPSADPAAGLATFETVRRVFQHPRCQNCHIPGDAPLQYGRGAAGLPCSTCHATRNPPANPARVFGGLVAVNGLLIALFEMGTVERLGRFRRLRVAALGMVLTGIGFGLTGMVMHWAWFLLTVVLWTFGEILSAPFKMAFVTDWAPPDRRGRYLRALGGPRAGLPAQCLVDESRGSDGEHGFTQPRDPRQQRIPSLDRGLDEPRERGDPSRHTSS